MGRTSTGSLWRNRDFMSYWVGESVSQVGSQVTFVALPLVAVLYLDADTGQLGVLRFVEYLPFIACTLAFGVWADRRGRRELILASYVVRAVMVALVPLLAFLGLLDLPALLAIALVVGAGSALFEVCWLPYVPTLVREDQLVDAMGKVSTSNSAAEVAGPGIGGLLVHGVMAPYALLVDVLSYLVAGVLLMRVRRREPRRAGPAQRRSPVRDVGDGLRFAFREPHIRATAWAAAMGNFFALITETVFLVYAVRVLRLGPELIGLAFTAVGVGGVVGAALSGRIARRWPMGRVYVGARLLGGAAALLLPLSGGPRPLVIGMCMASFFLVQAALANTNVLTASLRQALTPEFLRGRMNASVRTVVFGTLPLGGLAAAALGNLVGLRATLWFAAIGYAAAIVPVLASPIPRLRALPTGLARSTTVASSGPG